MTAHDFVFYVNTIKNTDVDSPSLRAYFDDLETAEAIDDYTLRLTWSKKVYSSLSTSFALEPLPRHIYKFDQNGEEYNAAQFGAAFNDHWFDLE